MDAMVKAGVVSTDGDEISEDAFEGILAAGGGSKLFRLPAREWPPTRDGVSMLMRLKAGFAGAS